MDDPCMRGTQTFVFFGFQPAQKFVGLSTRSHTTKRICMYFIELLESTAFSLPWQDSPPWYQNEDIFSFCFRWRHHFVTAWFVCCFSDELSGARYESQQTLKDLDLLRDQLRVRFWNMASVVSVFCLFWVHSFRWWVRCIVEIGGSRP